MIRLTIVLIHSVAAAITATSASLVLLQGLLNLAWEHRFYAEMTPTSLEMAAQGGGLLSVSIADVLLISAWFTGETRLTWVLVLTSLWIATSLPLALGLAFQGTMLLVLMDVMVQRHKEATAAS